MEAPTKPKTTYQRVMGKHWFIKLVGETTAEIWDGDELIATEICTIIPPLGDGSEFDRQLEMLSQVKLPDGRTFTLQPDRSWLTEEGKRMKLLITEIDESECGSYANYYLGAG